MLRKLTVIGCSFSPWHPRRIWPGPSGPCRIWASITTTASTGSRQEPGRGATNIGSRACRASRIRPSIRRSIQRCWPPSGSSIRISLPICPRDAVRVAAVAGVFWPRCGVLPPIRIQLARADASVLIAGLSPVAVVFSFSLMPELLFTRAAARQRDFGRTRAPPELRAGCAILAGVCGALGVSHQVRRWASAVHSPLYFALAKTFCERRHCSSPRCCRRWLAGNGGWPGTCRTPGIWSRCTTPITSAFQIYNVPMRDLPLVVWHNLDGFLWASGKLLTFDMPYGREAVGASGGRRRHRRLRAVWLKRTRKLQYPLAALGISGVLLVWHFPPDPALRFSAIPAAADGTGHGGRQPGSRSAVGLGEAGLWRSFRGCRIRRGTRSVGGIWIFCTVFGLAKFVPDVRRLPVRICLAFESL